MNTHAGFKLFISATPQPLDRTLDDFQNMTWVQVIGVGSFGETGVTTNLLTYDTWDMGVAQKGKGVSNAGDPPVEMMRKPIDPGQIIMRQAGAGRFNWGFKIEGGGRARYNLGLVTGPRTPNGRNEDFDIEAYVVGLQQRETEGPVGIPAGALMFSDGSPLQFSDGSYLELAA